jgi:hypothetical protein
MANGLYEVCILRGDDVLQTSQTDVVPFVPRKDDVIFDGHTKFKVLEVRIRYLAQGMLFTVYVEAVQPIKTS